MQILSCRRAIRKPVCWLGESEDFRTERGNAETPKLKEELMVWAVAGRLLHTLVRNTEPARRCASLRALRTESLYFQSGTLVHSGTRRN